nr:MAG TPA: Protein of unknown function (DUF1043) [Caudoviricetes sp.]
MRNMFYIFIIGILSGILGTNIYYHRQNRIQYERITELESELTIRQQELKEYNSRFAEITTELENNNKRAEQFVNSMGEQLDRDLATVKDTAGLLRILRTQLQELKNFYSRGNSNVIGSGNANRK